MKHCLALLENYLSQMYHVELKIKVTTESNTFASYLGFTSVDLEGRQLYTLNYDKRADFNFQITNLPFLSSTIPASPLYLTSYPICPGLLLVWMFYSEGDKTFK